MHCLGWSHGLGLLLGGPTQLPAADEYTLAAGLFSLNVLTLPPLPLTGELMLLLSLTSIGASLVEA